MKFEFDFTKSEVNKKKHGIDFIEAQALWEDPDFVEIPAKTSDEPRFLVIGRISNKYWCCVEWDNLNNSGMSKRIPQREKVKLYTPLGASTKSVSP